MADHEYVAFEERTIDAHPALVWSLVADTNRFDRAVGLTAGEYRFEERPGLGTTRVPVAHAKQMGFDIAWIEPPYEWVEGRSVRGARTFLSGPVTAGGFDVKLTPAGAGTRIAVRFYTRGTSFALRIAGPILRRQIQRGIKRYLDAIEGLLTTKRLEFDGKAPPSSTARRALMINEVDEVATGSRTSNHEIEFARRLARLREAPLDPAIVDRLAAFLARQPDDEVIAMRPFEIASAWGADRRELLRTFLHAARAGLVDLIWQINCPTCRVGAGNETSLSKLGRAGHCDACNISYDIDFALHVEAVFCINAAVRRTDAKTYCASSPWFRPHVFAQVGVEPNASEQFDAPTPSGSLLFRTLTGKRSVVINAEGDDELPPASVRVVVNANGLEVIPEGRVAQREDETHVTLENRTTERVVVLVERAGWNAEIVRGSVITTLPDFIDLFATEAPASGAELTIGTLTLLFTDLTGSTAMYERMGDARAFAIVQEHFRLLAEATDQHNGAIVKTMGDAIMASFSSPTDALRAAIDMVERTHATHGAEGLTVKIGLHEGPCLAVRANERLDFFGTTVNVAARLQAQAHPSEIVLMRDLLEHPDVARLLEQHRFPARLFATHLKGIREEQQLVAFDATPGAASPVAAKHTG